MPKVKKTFRIEEETAAHLGELAAREGVTATELLERAIRAYGSEPYAEPYACHTPENAVDEPPAGGTADDAVAAAAVAALTEQRAVTDRQRADLSSALVSAQKSIEQAHALHAADKQNAAGGMLAYIAARLQRAKRIIEVIQQNRMPDRPAEHPFRTRQKRDRAAAGPLLHAGACLGRHG